MNDCPFCNLDKQTKAILPLNIIDRYEVNILHSGKYLRIIPDIAPVIPFHILIVPNEHVFSMQTLSDYAKMELSVLKEKVSSFYKAINGKPALFFEHGSCNGDGNSACIIHAHLHCLPYSKRAYEQFYNRSNSSLTALISKQKHENYLQFEYCERTYYWEDNTEKKQFFRQLVSETEGNQRGIWQICLYSSESADNKAWVSECVYRWNNYFNKD